jgi:hypothetical protein
MAVLRMSLVPVMVTLALAASLLYGSTEDEPSTCDGDLGTFSLSTLWQY